MINNTQTTLTVTRNGYLDNDYYQAQARRDLLAAILSHFQAVLAGLGAHGVKLGREVYKGLKQVVFLIQLDCYDHAHGTHLRHEYFQNKRAGEISQLRAQF